MRIGYNKLLVSSSSITEICEELRDNNLDTIEVQSSFDYEESCDALLQGEFDSFIFPLHLVPYSRKVETKIWALCERKDLNNVLLIKKDLSDKSERIPIRKNEMVCITSDFLPENFVEIRADLEFEIIHFKKLLEDLHKQELNAAVVPQLFINEEILRTYLSLNLNEKEFGHAPGQGAYAVVAIKDSVFGAQLRGLHHLETAFACNIERKIALALDMKINLHVELDDNGSYHIYLNQIREKMLKKINFSQSTRLGIIEKIIALTKN